MLVGANQRQEFEFAGALIGPALRGGEFSLPRLPVGL